MSRIIYLLILGDSTCPWKHGRSSAFYQFCRSC